MTTSRSELIEAWAPQIEVEPSDGKALLTFNTARGPVALLLNADVVLLLRDRLEKQLARRL